MLRRIIPNAVLPKFLALFVSMFLIMAAVGLWPLMHYDERTNLNSLSSRIGNQSARAIAALTRHDALEHPALARDLMTPLMSDKAVLCAELRWADTSGDSKTTFTGLECDEVHQQNHFLALPLGDARGTQLLVRFTANEVLAAARLQQTILLGVLLLATGLATLSAFIGLRLVEGGRLKALSTSLRGIASGGARDRVATGSADEIGQIMRAFNEMSDREDEREAALEAAMESSRASQSELKRLNDELKDWIHKGESERRFRDFVAAASDWYWEMDAELRFSYFSDRFTEITGVPKENLLGKTREETGIPGVTQEIWQEHLDHLHSHRAFRGFEHPRIMSNGSTVWLSINGSPAFDDEGNFVGYRGTGSEITERVRAKDLARDKEVSEKLARTKGEFLANMSHEIRTPINGVLGMTEILLKTELDLKQRRYADNVLRCGTMLLDVVNDVLDFSKISAGKMTLESEPFDMQEVVEDIMEMFAQRAQEKGLEVIASTPTDLQRLHLGDAPRLRQVLTNLIGNAIKFTEHGHVVLRLSEQCDANGLSTVKFEVEDTGIGICKDAQAKIFESFAQADGSTSRHYGGTGLGLSISHQLVELMGDELKVRSTPDAGSTFFFELALPTRPWRQVTSHAEEDFTQTSVLVVDDNAICREVLLREIRALGSRVQAAANAADAITLLRSNMKRGTPHNIVLIDQQMPEVDGLTLARQIASEPSLTETRGALLVPISKTYDENALEGTNIDLCVAKPVRRAELHQCLGAMISAGNTSAQPAGPAPETEETQPLVSEGRVLVAEDNLVNQQVALIHLKSMGMEVDVVEDGRGAVDAWRVKSYDVILMDCQMPGLNGFDAVREIRAIENDKSLARTPVVALTANAMQGDREKCLDAGMDDYLSKPFTAEQLEAALQRWSSGDGETLESARQSA